MDDEPNGLAFMIGGLIEANLAHDPDRTALLRSSVVGLSAVDAEVSVTLRLGDERASIANGEPNPSAHLVIRASSADLIRLSAIPLRFGLPDPLTREGRAVLGDILRRTIRVRGMVRHPVRLARLTRVLSVT